jgi:hypothetical protein
MRKKQEAPLVLPTHARLAVPIMAATGGQGRSTVAGLLAAELARSGAGCVVCDTTGQTLSPWPGWAAKPGKGLESIPPNQPLSMQHARDAASTCAAPGAEWQVLTSHQAWTAGPLQLPVEPLAWCQLAAIGSWQALVADTGYAVLDDMVGARASDTPSLTARWFDPGGVLSVPVLCVEANGRDIEILQAVVEAAEVSGLPTGRFVVAVTARGGSSDPRTVRAGLTMLAPRVGAIVRLPHDEAVHAFGLKLPERVSTRTRQAAAYLARRVVGLAGPAPADPGGGAAHLAPATGAPTGADT